MTSQVTRLPAIIEDIGDFASMTHLNAWGSAQHMGCRRVCIGWTWCGCRVTALSNYVIQFKFLQYQTLLTIQFFDQIIDSPLIPGPLNQIHPLKNKYLSPCFESNEAKLFLIFSCIHSNLDGIAVESFALRHIKTQTNLSFSITISDLMVREITS